MIDAVLLDLDDTCFDQREFLAGAFGAVARRVGELGVDEVGMRDALVAIAAAGSDRGRIIDRALETLGVRVPVGPLVDVFRAYRPARLSPYPGVREGLGQMRGLAPVGLVTNGDPAGQRAKIAALGLDDAFDAVVVSDELGRSFRKPHPAPFCQALRLLGADPGRSFFIGDHPGRDIAGAQHVGMRAVRVRTGEYASQPDVVTPWRTAPDAASALRGLCELEPDDIVRPMDLTLPSAPLVSCRGRLTTCGSGGEARKAEEERSGLSADRSCPAGLRAR